MQLKMVLVIFPSNTTPGHRHQTDAALDPERSAGLRDPRRLAQWATPVTPRGHVVDGTWKLDSQWSCHLQHRRKLTAQVDYRRDLLWIKGKKQDLTPASASASAVLLGLDLRVLGVNQAPRIGGTRISLQLVTLHGP